MKVVVTGGSGLAGFAALQELVEHGYQVASMDLSPPPQAIAPYQLVDCTDIGQVFAGLAGAEAVVHLAAIPRPIYHTPEQVFRTNVMATFNVLEVAATLGIQRVVYVSSVSVLGAPFHYNSFAPRYVPIDEDHPRLPEDAYGLSKYLGEELAEGFVRRCAGALSVVSLRFPWIHTPQSFREQLWPHWDDPEFGATNLWSYVDARDVGRACRLALTADIAGHEAMFVSAAGSFMNQDIVPLVRRLYPDTEIKAGFSGNRSLLDNTRAGRLLGYQPAYSWEMYGLA